MRSLLGLKTLLLSVLVAAMMLGGCGSGANSDPVSALLMSDAEERQIGLETHPKILQAFGGEYDDPKINAYVERVGQTLVRTAGRQYPHPFKFTVVDSPIINAFALPGGFVYVSRGLVSLASNEAELAAVLGHEIGHVVARHPRKRYSRGVLANILATGAAVATGSSAIGQLAGLGGGVFLASYSRSQEFEADVLGIRYLNQHGYDADAMSSFLAKLRRHTQLEARKENKSPGEVDQFGLLSTHPRTLERVQQAKAEAGAVAGKGQLNTFNYLRHIEGIIYGDSPEQGFVKGRTFIHTELDFRFDVPQGFVIQNQPTQVMAKDRRGAMIIFENAVNSEGLSMGNYLVSRFGRRLDLSRIEPLNVNGMPAATAATTTQTNLGTRHIRLLAVRMNRERAYLFWFVTPPNLTGDYNVPFRETTYSFRRLRPDEKIAAKPQRIRLRRVNPGDTIQDLARYMEHVRFPVDTFMIINGLQPGQQPPAGAFVKTVED